jgi:hypothetical protein
LARGVEKHAQLLFLERFGRSALEDRHPPGRCGHGAGTYQASGNHASHPRTQATAPESTDGSHALAASLNAANRRFNLLIDSHVLLNPAVCGHVMPSTKQYDTIQTHDAPGSIMRPAAAYTLSTNLFLLFLPE